MVGGSVDWFFFFVFFGQILVGLVFSLIRKTCEDQRWGLSMCLLLRGRRVNDEGRGEIERTSREGGGASGGESEGIEEMEWDEGSSGQVTQRSRGIEILIVEVLSLVLKIMSEMKLGLLLDKDNVINYNSSLSTITRRS